VKILYFSPHPHINMSAPSGPGTHIREVIAGFEAHGHQVIRMIAGGEEISNTSGHIQIRNHKWKKFIPGFIWQTLRDVMLQRLDKTQERALIDIIQKEKPDFIYERSYYLMGAGHRVSQKTGVRYCCEMNAPYPEEKKQMNGSSLLDHLGLDNERKQLAAARKVFVVSSALKKYVCEKVHGIEEKVIVIPNAVNPAHIRASQFNREKLRKEIGIKEHAIVLGFVGSIFPYHGVDALIEAFATLRNSAHNNLHLLVVGDGEILAQLKERVKELGISEHVTFTGNIPHQKVYQYIDQMDIAIMARSNWYGSPVKIFEYGIMEKCIIAPDVIPVRDVMKHGEDGLLVSDNLPSLQEAIKTLLDDEPYRRRLAANFHRKVKEQHTWNKVSETILNEMK
jgi:glycosyltransferase involved in cell wall biosynthesis